MANIEQIKEFISRGQKAQKAVDKILKDQKGANRPKRPRMPQGEKEGIRSRRAAKSS